METGKKLRLLADRVLIRPIEAEKVTTGGIIIPDTAVEKPQKGEVISVGCGTGDTVYNSDRTEKRKANELTVKDGDIVFYGKFAGTEIEVNGEKLIILRESEILAIIE